MSHHQELTRLDTGFVLDNAVVWNSDADERGTQCIETSYISGRKKSRRDRTLESIQSRRLT